MGWVLDESQGASSVVKKMETPGNINSAWKISLASHYENVKTECSVSSYLWSAAARRKSLMHLFWSVLESPVFCGVNTAECREHGSILNIKLQLRGAQSYTGEFLSACENSCIFFLWLWRSFIMSEKSTLEVSSGVILIFARNLVAFLEAQDHHLHIRTQTLEMWQDAIHYELNLKKTCQHCPRLLRDSKVTQQYNMGKL